MRGPWLPACAPSWPATRGGRPNLGDELAPYLIRKIARLPSATRLRRRPDEPRGLTEPVLLSVGSVLRLCSGNSVVWGSGIRNIDQPVAAARRFCAVRGPLTRERLSNLGYDCPAVFGDPALLTPRYFHPSVQERFRLGIIPHGLDHRRLSRLYSRQPGVLVIDVSRGDVEGIIRQLLSCERTVSSALHGLVLSVAYGIPTRWLKCSEKIMGDDSKIYDFFASLDGAVAEALCRRTVTLPPGEPALEPYRPIRLGARAIPWRELAERTFGYPLTASLDDLLQACPIDETGWKPAEHPRPGSRLEAGSGS